MIDGEPAGQGELPVTIPLSLGRVVYDVSGEHVVDQSVWVSTSPHQTGTQAV